RRFARSVPRVDHLAPLVENYHYVVRGDRTEPDIAPDPAELAEHPLLVQVLAIRAIDLGRRERGGLAGLEFTVVVAAIQRGDGTLAERVGIVHLHPDDPEMKPPVALGLPAGDVQPTVAVDVERGAPQPDDDLVLRVTED